MNEDKFEQFMSKVFETYTLEDFYEEFSMSKFGSRSERDLAVAAELVRLRNLVGEFK